MCSIEIVFPEDRITVNQKREYLTEIYNWGVDNLEDPDNNWKYFKMAVDEMRLKENTEQVTMEIYSEFDSMALKLTWG